jgi:hypothetical protein
VPQSADLLGDSIVDRMANKISEKAARASRYVVLPDLVDEYAMSPDWMIRKVASRKLSPDLRYAEPAAPSLPADPARFFKRADGALQRLRNERDRLYADVQTAWDKVAAAFGGLQTYFRQVGSLPIEDVQANVEALHGAAGEALFDKLASMSGMCMASGPVQLKKKKKADEKDVKATQLKRASANHAVDGSRAPYSLVTEIVNGAKAHSTAFNKAAEFEKSASALELKLHRALAAESPTPLAPDPSLSLLRRLHGEKRAFGGPIAGTLMTGAQLGLGATAGQSILSKISPKTDAKLKSDAMEAMSDPGHEAQLRSIRAQAALHGILNGPYFEGEDPVKVTELFNNLTRLAPRMADQPLLLESAMRRLAAQGNADPHDLDQLLGIETKIKMRDKAPKDETTPEQDVA